MSDGLYLCDYRHEGDQPPADWAFIGEAGDYYLCDEHFSAKTAGWRRIERPAAARTKGKA